MGPERVTLTLAHRADATSAAVFARRFARSAGLSPTECEKVALAVMELCTNAVRHGGGGQLCLESNGHGVVVEVSDNGPGMAEPTRLFEQRVRSPQDPPWAPGTSLGAGGSAVQRLMDEVSASTAHGGGLRVRAVKLRR